MLDIKFIRENKEKVKKAIKDKQLVGTVDIDKLLEVDSKYVALLQKVETHRALKNKLSEDISKLASDKDARQKLIDEATKLKEEMVADEAELKELKVKFDEMMLWVPNVAANDVPVGVDETQNEIFRTVGEKPEFDFEPKDHIELGASLGIIDTKRGTKIAGFRGYFIVGDGMLLEQALLRYALDFMIEQGFTPMNVPLMVNNEYLVGTGYFPWGAEDHYKTQDDQALIGTAEVSLTSYYANEVLEEKDLPVKLTGQSACFRREVGSHGKDTKGAYRVHYFNKVEQMVLVKADENESIKWHEKMLGFTEQIWQNLGLHYNVMLMCTGDIGAGQRKKYDIEVWFPGQKRYGELGSASYFNDFQSRRLNMRYKTKEGQIKFVHTLNNTVLPTPRALVCILENYQQKDGSVKIPKVLQPYMNGQKIIKPK